jgi:hypothetical protein
MISVFRAPDKNTGKIMPLVIVALGAEDVILTIDTETPTPAVGLEPYAAREVARRLIAFADEIEREGKS